MPRSSVITTVHMRLAMCLHYFTFAFVSVWRNARQLVFEKPKPPPPFFYSTLTHRKSDREPEAVHRTKIKPFSPPISLESQSVLNDFQNRRWSVSVSPLNFICRIFGDQKATRLFLRWALIAWSPMQSLNTVVWMSLPQCQLKKGPLWSSALFSRRHSWGNIGASQRLWLK